MIQFILTWFPIHPRTPSASNNNIYPTKISPQPFLRLSSAELEPAFPYRQVQLKEHVDPRQTFDILPELGRGTFGTVFLCREKASGLELAAKIVSCNKKKERTDAIREIDIMSCLHHPRLIQLFDAFDYENKVYVILEL